MELIKEFFEFLKERKKWWLTPIVLCMVVLGTLLVLSSSSPVPALIYTLF